ncbi:hypothetical protein J6G99_01910 [bacterium]|nr:hypothetical protein [bacterium]
MSEYLVLAENVLFKNNKLTCINIYDRLTTVAMPAEFKFDLAILCGPNWKAGEHKLAIKAKANNGKEVSIGDLTVEIPNEDFVYNAYANDLKIVMDYSVSDLTIIVEDNGKEIISRKYPVVSMLVPQKQEGNKKASKKESKK